MLVRLPACFRALVRTWACPTLCQQQTGEKERQGEPEVEGDSERETPGLEGD